MEKGGRKMLFIETYDPAEALEPYGCAYAFYASVVESLVDDESLFEDDDE